MPRINSTSCNVTVISPQGMWKLLVSGCHLSIKADSKEEFGCWNMQDLKCDSPISPANCTTAESLGVQPSGTTGSCGHLSTGHVYSQPSFFYFFLCIGLVGGRDFSGLFCRDPAIILITDMKLLLNPFPLPGEQARDYHRHHYHHVHHHPHAHLHRPHCYECGGNQP
ncbi:hypothetical protein M9H77_24062 [Catharanthus roseus]|uniref:Uncharacterized protein n=1 Tax=Catharanthus roseus TaxID=4058 RepID=A0ACC0AX85_CATRO|nr:hypothetical protein M9H77_24062 [Catharanthus roseus]